MPGRTIRAFSRRRFNHTGAELPVNAVIFVTMAERIDVSGYKTIELQYRLHESSLSNNQKIDVVAVADGYTDEDPGRFFRTSQATGIASASFGNTTTDPAPAYKIAQSTAAFGPLITILVKVTQHSAAINFDATISCDVHMKEC